MLMDLPNFLATWHTCHEGGDHGQGMTIMSEPIIESLDEMIQNLMELPVVELELGPDLVQSTEGFLWDVHPIFGERGHRSKRPSRTG